MRTSIFIIIVAVSLCLGTSASWADSDEVDETASNVDNAEAKAAKKASKKAAKKARKKAAKKARKAAKKARKKAAKKARKAARRSAMNAGQDDRKSKKRGNKRNKRKVTIRGRVFATSTLQKVDVRNASWFHTFGITSARLQATYRASKRVKTTVKVDFQGNKARLKDVLMRLQQGAIRVDVGRFKRPTSPMALESARRLPTVERGLLNDDLLANGNEVPLPFSGRAEGVLVRYRTKLPTKITVIGALMNSRLAEDSSGDDAFLPVQNKLRDGYLRVVVQPNKTVQIGLGGSYIGRVATSTGRVDQILGGSADVVIEHRWGRVWLEGFYGQTPYVEPVNLLLPDPPPGTAHGNMMAARALVAPRLYRSNGTVRSVDVFALANVIDLSSDLARDWAWEAGGGAVVQFEHQWRVQVQYVRRTTGNAYPMAGLDRVYLQLGSAF